MAAPRLSRSRLRPALVALYLCAATLLMAPVAVSAQVSTDLSPRSVAVGESVSLRIVVDHEEPEDVAMAAPDLPGLRVVEGPSVRPVTVTDSGSRSRAVEIAFRFIAERAGRYVIAPLPIDVAGQRYETDAKVIEIGEATNRSRVPFQGRWLVTNTDLVVGEATTVYLEIYNVRDYLYPSSISVSVPSNAIFEEIQGIGTIEQSEVDGVTLYSIPVAAFMLTPTAAGLVVIPRATVEAQEMTVPVERAEFEVSPAPPEIAASGAVGSFSLSATIDTTLLSVSERATLRVRVSGTGNLHFLDFPVIETTLFEIGSESVHDLLEPTDLGYSGYRERVLELRPVSGGTGEIRVEPLIYFDPTRQRVGSLDVDLPPVEITTVKVPQSEETDSAGFALLPPEVVHQLERSDAFRSPLSYGWLLPGVIVLLGRLLWRRQPTGVAVLLVASLFLFGAAAPESQAEVENLLASASEAFADGDLALATETTEEASMRFPRSPGIHYNLAVLYFAAGDIPRAAYSAREAIRLNPHSEVLRRGLEIIEDNGGVEDSVAPAQVVHPEVFFAVLAASTNLLFLVVALAFKRQRGVVLLVESFLVLLIVASSIGLGWAASVQRSSAAVVLHDATLRRIPEKDAQAWRSVTPGTAVKIVARSGNDVLVRTGIGHEGWLTLREVLWGDNPVQDDIRSLRPDNDGT